MYRCSILVAFKIVLMEESGFSYKIQDVLVYPEKAQPKEERPRPSRKRMFTPQEDERICDAVGTYGAGNWKYIASLLKDRTSRQCRERYFMYLRPDVKNSAWTQKEDRKLKSLVAKFGQRWAKIATAFNGRSANNIKNRWHHLGRRDFVRRPSKPRNVEPAPNILEVDPNVRALQLRGRFHDRAVV
jgi:hypothetical protein